MTLHANLIMNFVSKNVSCYIVTWINLSNVTSQKKKNKMNMHK